MLGQIASVVEEFAEHPECTTLQAVELMKLRLIVAEAKLSRDAITRSWHASVR